MGGGGRTTPGVCERTAHEWVGRSCWHIDTPASPQHTTPSAHPTPAHAPIQSRAGRPPLSRTPLAAGLRRRGRTQGRLQCRDPLQHREYVSGDASVAVLSSSGGSSSMAEAAAAAAAARVQPMHDAHRWAPSAAHCCAASPQSAGGRAGRSTGDWVGHAVHAGPRPTASLTPSPPTDSLLSTGAGRATWNSGSG